MDLRNTLRFLGILIQKKSFVFGDNDSAVSGSMTPNDKIYKRHVALSFHRVREAAEAKIMSCHFMKGPANPADILSKHWGHSKVWLVLKAVLFWKGDTMNCFKDEDLS